MMADVDSTNKVIASFAKNSREMVCVGTNEYKGKQLIFVRLFVPALDKDELVPTPSGVSLPVEKAAELLAGVQALKDNKDPERVVAKISKNKSQEIWIGANTYKGLNLIYIRTYAVYGDSTEYRPTKDGVSMKADLFPSLLDAITKLGEAASV
jgi:hypothetical protein